MESKYYHLTGGTHSFLVLHDLLNPSEEFPIHTQSDWELIYIIRGCGTFVIGDQSQPFTKDEIFLIPPDMLHGWIFDNNPGNVIEDICLLFRKNLFKELSVTLPEIGPLGHLDSRQHTAFQLRGDLLKNVRHEMQEIIKTDSLGQLSGVIRILGHLALSDEMNPTGINRPLKKRDKKIQQIEIYVSLHYNHDIPIDEIASLVHMNRSSFCVFFKRMKGVSFTNYLNTYRMDIACRLLSTTDKSVSEIAYGVGFNNLSHFCRTFLKYKEVSPTKYRNRMGHGHSDITTTPPSNKRRPQFCGRPEFIFQQQNLLFYILLFAARSLSLIAFGLFAAIGLVVAFCLRVATRSRRFTIFAFAIGAITLFLTIGFAFFAAFRLGLTTGSRLSHSR